MYCEELAAGARGSAPPDLQSGERYCFMGTALDERNQAYAIGCTVAVVGGEPIDVALSPIEDGRIIRRRCQSVPDVRFDAGVRMDAGPGPTRDAGPGFDAGVGVDAGPPPMPDAGPAVNFRSPVRVYFEVSGPGQVGVFDDDGDLMGGYLYNGHRLWVDAWVGFYSRIEATPDPGARITRIDVPHCGNMSPCEFLYAENEVIEIEFASQP